MAKSKNAPKNTKNALDTSSGKRGRGRPVMISASTVWGRAQNYRGILDIVWDRLSPVLLNAETADDVIKAFEQGRPYEAEFMPHLASLFAKVLKDKDSFPKRRQTQINFLADSVAGCDVVSPRRSRDICAREHAKTKRARHVIRYEFYIECSCRYKGRSKDHGCPKCGTKIEFPPSLGGHLF